MPNSLRQNHKTKLNLIATRPLRVPPEMFLLQESKELNEREKEMEKNLVATLGVN